MKTNTSNGTNTCYDVIYQDNRISQTARAERESLSLTRYQINFLHLLIARIKKSDEDIRVEEISFAEYCDVMNIKPGGTTNKQIRKSLLDLGRKVFLVDTTPTKTEMFSWIEASETEIDWEKKVIRTRLGKRLEGFYIGLSKQYTVFQIGFTTSFKSKYSYRLYEYLKSYEKQGVITIKIENAYEVFTDKKYTLLNDLERRVLQKAISEINTYSDIHVSYTRIKDGRTTTHLCFSIATKSKEDIEKLRAEWTPKKVSKLVNINEQIAASFTEELAKPKYGEEDIL